MGLDPIQERIPSFLKLSLDYIFGYNKSIVDCTSDLVCAYKINFAHYISHGKMGLKSLYRTLNYIPAEIPVIFDCKYTGDISSNIAFAKSVFEELNIAALTVLPYFGFDKLRPYFQYDDKGIFVTQRIISEKNTIEMDVFSNNIKTIAELWQKNHKTALFLPGLNEVTIQTLLALGLDLPVMIGDFDYDHLLHVQDINRLRLDDFYPIITVSDSVVSSTKDKDYAETIRNVIIDLKKRIVSE